MTTSRYTPVEAIKGDSDEDGAALREMAGSARSYIASFQWCPRIERMFLAYGVGEVVAIFLVELAQAINGRDKYLWVIEGDLPIAYLVTEGNPTPSTALDAYCRLMSDWAEAVVTKKDLSDLFPVAVAASPENADALLRRVRFLRERIIPTLEQQEATWSSAESGGETDAL
jgi:hypothetical protein